MKGQIAQLASASTLGVPRAGTPGGPARTITLRSAKAILPLALVSLIAIFYLTTIRRGHVWGDDDALYIHHAKNIAQGLKYADTGYFLCPTSLSPQTYPPIFPLLLAPLCHWYGLALTPMKVECICFFCVALYLLYLLLKNEASERLALTTVAFVGFCPYFWDFKDILYSEYPFLAFTYATLYLAQQGVGCNSRKSCLGLGAIAGLLGYLAYGTRTVGFLVIFAVLLHQIMVWRRLTAFSVAAGVVFAIGVAAQKLILVSSPDYVGSFIRVVTVRDFLVAPWHYFVSLAVLWDNGRSGPMQALTYAITIVLALRCAWVRWRQKWSVFDVFAVLYGLFIIWFPWGGKRYLMPIMPFYVFYILAGLESFAGSLPSARGWLQTGVAAVLMAGYVSKYTTVDWAEVPEGIQDKKVQEMVQYVKREIGPTGLVVFEKARFLSLYGETRASDIYEIVHFDTMLDYYHRVGVTHLIIPRKPVEERTMLLTQLVAARPAQFEKKFDNGAFAIYKMR